MKTITAPGFKNLITDVSGVQVGHAEDYKIGTGVTVITGDNPFSAAVDVRGGGPGTRETDMLSLENSIGRADAIVLSGVLPMDLTQVQKYRIYFVTTERDIN